MQLAKTGSSTMLFALYKPYDYMYIYIFIHISTNTDFCLLSRVRDVRANGGGELTKKRYNTVDENSSMPCLFYKWFRFNCPCFCWTWTEKWSTLIFFFKYTKLWKCKVTAVQLSSHQLNSRLITEDNLFKWDLFFFLNEGHWFPHLCLKTVFFFYQELGLKRLENQILWR